MAAGNLPGAATAVVQSPELALGIIMLLALTAYTLLAGADFGGGVWDLLARGPRAAGQRQAIARAIAPVWEANHVWLIFLIVILFTAFPRAFAALSVALFAPFHLVLLGIVLRGAAFVFRSYTDPATRPHRFWASTFGAASTITPFLLGVSLASVSTAAIRVSRGGVTVDVQGAWLSPFSLLTGLLALTLAAYLAAVYLTVETEGRVQEDFRAASLGSAVVRACLRLLCCWSCLRRPRSFGTIFPMHAHCRC